MQRRTSETPEERLSALLSRYEETSPDERPACPGFAEAAKGGSKYICSLAGRLDSLAATLAAEKEVQNSANSKYEHIVNTMPEAVIAVNRSGIILGGNPAAQRLFPQKTLEGASLLALSSSTELAALADGVFADAAPAESEIALYSASGAQSWFRVLASPLDTQLILLVLIDITALRGLERVRRDFVANVSHELRTPIQLVKGFAETLQSGDLSPAERAHYLEIIGRNADRMENLIEDLLSLSRLEQQGQSRIEAEDITISSIIDEAVEYNAAKAKAKSIGIRVDAPQQLRAELNRGLTVEAVCNLLDNAIKYSPENTSVLVRSWEEGGDVYISVKDQGIGIPGKDLPRLFERFYRVDKARSRAQGGTGLGLAIVKHIALAQGGSVQAESWEGEGSRFTLRFPLHPAQGRSAGR